MQSVFCPTKQKMPSPRNFWSSTEIPDGFRPWGLGLDTPEFHQYFSNVFILTWKCSYWIEINGSQCCRIQHIYLQKVFFFLLSFIFPLVNIFLLPDNFVWHCAPTADSCSIVEILQLMSQREMKRKIRSQSIGWPIFLTGPNRNIINMELRVCFLRSLLLCCLAGSLSESSCVRVFCPAGQIRDDIHFCAPPRYFSLPRQLST